MYQSPAVWIDGNTLTIDQSLTTGGLAAGVDAGLLDAIRNGDLIGIPGAVDITSANILSPPFATQRGEGNHATLTLPGYGGEVHLFPDHGIKRTPLIPGGKSSGNIATINAYGDVLGAVAQSAPTTPRT